MTQTVNTSTLLSAQISLYSKVHEVLVTKDIKWAVIIKLILLQRQNAHQNKGNRISVYSEIQNFWSNKNTPA